MIRRRGFLMLTEARSGSNWLGSLATDAGIGRLGEWLAPGILGQSFAEHSAQDWSEMALDRATANGIFHLKLFPRYLYLLHTKAGFDFLHHCLNHHDSHLVLLQRRDRISQAISLARGQQTGQWNSSFAAKAEPVYDYALICRCLFHIGRSYDFWDMLIAAMRLPAKAFFYEDLSADPSPFLDHLANTVGLARPAPQISRYAIQRDALSKVWRDRFHQDAQRLGVLDFASSRAATIPPAWPPHLP